MNFRVLKLPTLLRAFDILTAIFALDFVSELHMVYLSVLQFCSLNRERLNVFCRIWKRFSTVDSSRASLIRFYLFDFIPKEGAFVSFIFMNPSLPANKSSRHPQVSISLEVIRGTIINQTQRHNLFTPLLIDALPSFFKAALLINFNALGFIRVVKIQRRGKEADRPPAP